MAKKTRIAINGFGRIGRLAARELIAQAGKGEQLRLRAIGIQVPYQLLLALPYLVTILALALAGRNASYPSALLKPYKREG